MHLFILILFSFIVSVLPVRAEEPFLAETQTYENPTIDDARAHAIVLAGSPQDVRKLINSGYDLNKPYLCNTLLSTAVKSIARQENVKESHIDALKKILLLLNNGADVNLRACTDDGMKPLSWAVSLPFLLINEENNTIKALRNQIKNSADYCDYPDIVSKPCRYVQPDEQQKIEQSIHASYKQRMQDLLPYMMKAIKLLIKRGADVNMADYQKQTPLHYAAGIPEEMTTEPLQYLLTHGAKPNQLNTYGQNPLFIAYAAKNPNNVNTLLEYGADGTIRDKYEFLFNQSKTASFRVVITKDSSVLMEILY